jgi:hypothetical protein
MADNAADSKALIDANGIAAGSRGLAVGVSKNATAIGGAVARLLKPPARSEGAEAEDVVNASFMAGHADAAAAAAAGGSAVTLRAKQSLPSAAATAMR